MKTLYVDSFETALGTLHVASTERGLALVGLPGEPAGWFEKQIEKHFAGYRPEPGGELNCQAQKQLTAYADGSLRQFTLPLDWHTTPFQLKVLKRVAEIPYGRTMTYGELARAVGSPNASRAVGHANATNPLPIVVPCHRVVASNGFGGYGGGLELKVRLLRLEGAI